MKQKFSIPGARNLLLLAALALAIAPTLSAQEARTPRRRGWLGFAFDSAGAVVVRRIEPGSPAARAGLQPGDTVIRFNGRPVTAAMLMNETLEPGDTVRLGLRRRGLEQQLVLVAEPRRFPRSTSIVALNDSIIATVTEDSVRRVIRIYLDSILARIDELDLPYIRVDEEETREPSAIGWGRRLRIIGDPGVTVEHIRSLRSPDSIREVIARAYSLTPPPPPPPVGAPPPPSPPPMTPPPPPQPIAGIWVIGRSSVAGAEFTELNPGLARYFEGTKEGLLVLRVARGTPAEKAGLEPGDVVVAINGRDVRDIADLRLSIARAGREGVRFEVVREGERKELSMTSPMSWSGMKVFRRWRFPEK